MSITSDQLNQLVSMSSELKSIANEVNNEKEKKKDQMISKWVSEIMTKIPLAIIDKYNELRKDSENGYCVFSVTIYTDNSIEWYQYKDACKKLSDEFGTKTGFEVVSIYENNKYSYLINLKVID